MTINERCFFLGGQPRSGTTLLTSLLNSSIDLFQAYELHIRKPSFILGNNKNYTKNIFKYLGLNEKLYLNIIDKHKENFKYMNLGSWTGPKESSSAEQLTGSETLNFSSELLYRGRLVSEMMSELKYIHKKKYWGFKILNDMVHIDKYFKVWPNAFFIILVRDPRDHAISVLKLNEQRIKRNQQLFFKDYEDVAYNWIKDYQTTLEKIDEYKINSYIIKYEYLVQNPYEAKKELEEKLSINNIDIDTFNISEKIKLHSQRFEHHKNLLNKINSDSVNKWKKIMTEEENKKFLKIAGNLMSRFNYE